MNIARVFIKLNWYCPKKSKKKYNCDNFIKCKINTK